MNATAGSTNERTDGGPGVFANMTTERALLGAAMLNPTAMKVLIDSVPAEAFYRPSHQAVARAIYRIDGEGHTPDTVSVAAAVLDAGEAPMSHSDESSLTVALMDMVADCPTTTIGVVDGWCAEVRDRWQLRAMWAALTDAAARCRGEGHPADLLREAEEHVSSAMAGLARGSVPRVLNDWLAEHVEHLESGTTETTVSTGFPDIDSMLGGGLATKRLYYLGARPSMGKSALATQMALSVARRGVPSLFVSVEMTGSEIVGRILSSETGLPQAALQAGNVSARSWEMLNEAFAGIGDVPLWIDESPSVTVRDIRSMASQVRARAGKVGLIVVDYVQLLISGTAGSDSARQAELASISRALKILAREHECPVLALAQLNRGLEARSNKRPMLSDLRESGSLEQDADVVAFLYRDEVYNADTAEEGVAEVIVSKNRHGATGTAKLFFDGPRYQFTSMARRDYPG